MRLSFVVGGAIRDSPEIWLRGFPSAPPSGRREELPLDRVLVVDHRDGPIEFGQHLEHIGAVGPLDAH